MTIELKGKSCYVSGTIEKYTKKELRKILEKKGMIWKKAINGDLDYLIIGDDPGTKKIEIAKEIGIEIIEWKIIQAQLS